MSIERIKEIKDYVNRNLGSPDGTEMEDYYLREMKYLLAALAAAEERVKEYQKGYEQISSILDGEDFPDDFSFTDVVAEEVYDTLKEMEALGEEKEKQTSVLEAQLQAERERAEKAEKEMNHLDMILSDYGVKEYISALEARLRGVREVYEKYQSDPGHFDKELLHRPRLLAKILFEAIKAASTPKKGGPQ